MKYKVVGKEQHHGMEMERICATKDFVCQGVVIHAGELGGLIQSVENLSQEDNSWVADDASVYGAVVPKNALVCGDGWAHSHGVDRELLQPYVCGWVYIVKDTA